MKRLFLISVASFVIFMIHVNVYASEVVESETYVGVVEPETGSTATPPEEEVVSGVYYSDNQDANINSVLNDPNATTNDLLRALLVCVKDIDIYVQFFVTMCFAIGLVYFVILKPIRYFLQ